MNQILTRSTAIEILCRRLDTSSGRLTGLAQRIADAGMLPRAVGRDIPNLCSLELARLFLAAVADNGLGRAAATVTEFEALVTENGVTLGDVLSGIFRGDTGQPGDAAFQLEPAAAMLTVGTNALYFGSDLQAGSAVRITHIPSQIMKAITYEFSGHSPEEADKLTFQSTRDELHKARGKQANLTGELREIEKIISGTSHTTEGQRTEARARGVRGRHAAALFRRQQSRLARGALGHPLRDRGRLDQPHRPRLRGRLVPLRRRRAFCRVLCPIYAEIYGRRPPCSN